MKRNKVKKKSEYRIEARAIMRSLSKEEIKKVIIFKQKAIANLEEKKALSIH